MPAERIELKADSEALAGLTDRITYISLGNSRRLKFAGQRGAEIRVHARDVAPYFEVFALELHTTDMGGAEPGPWRPWPFRRWKVEVLTREEFVAPADPSLPTLGRPVNVQDAVRPGQVPEGATASCLVDAGLLFTGEDGRRLMIAVDWMPYGLIVSEDEAEIGDFLGACVTAPLPKTALTD